LWPAPMTTPSKLVMQPPARRLRDLASMRGTYNAGGNATTELRPRRGAHKKMPRQKVPGQCSRTLVRENDVRQFKILRR